MAIFGIFNLGFCCQFNIVTAWSWRLGSRQISLVSETFFLEVNEDIYWASRLVLLDTLHDSWEDC